MLKPACFPLCVALLGACSLLAQYPAPSGPPASGPPVGYPPGGYPPGTTPQQPVPAGETRIPKKEKKDKKRKKQEDRPIISAEGHTLANDGKNLIVKVDDGRTLTMAIGPDTKWTRAGADIDASKIAPHSLVKVDAAEEENFDLSLVHAELLKDAPTEAEAIAEGKKAAVTQAQAAQSSDPDADLTQSRILHSPDAPDRPVLRHQKPKAAKETTTSDVEVTSQPSEMDFTIDSDSKAPRRNSAGSELLTRTTDWLETFMQGLPNYQCQQETARYMQENKSDDWHPQDVVSAQVIYENGNDTYRNISLDGKRTNKTMMQLGGQTSTGEFSGLLESLFQPVRNTDFTYERTATLGDTETAVYGFKVALGSSDWQIIVGGQVLMPAYSGRIWVDKKTGEIRRLEQHADNIPKDFPNDYVTTAVDYDDVSLGTSKYLLPIQSENIGCQRATQYCGKNVIQFRDYHKYAGESTITFH